jgi:hypothetical protein
MSHRTTRMRCPPHPSNLIAERTRIHRAAVLPLVFFLGSPFEDEPTSAHKTKYLHPIMAHQNRTQQSTYVLVAKKTASPLSTPLRLSCPVVSPKRQLGAAPSAFRGCGFRRNRTTPSRRPQPRFKSSRPNVTPPCTRARFPDRGFRFNPVDQQMRAQSLPPMRSAPKIAPPPRIR